MNRTTLSNSCGNISRLLWNTAARTPTAVAITSRDEQVDYAALRESAAGYAALLLDAGIRPGERVAVFLERGAAAAAAFFGAAATGAVAVMVNESLRPRQVEHILGHSGARVLISSADLLARLPRPLATHAQILTDTPSVFNGWRRLRPVPATAWDPASIIYTSGSTGLPRGVTVSHGNLAAGVRSVGAYLGTRSSDRIASLLPFSFDYGFNQLLGSVAVGATLVIERSPLARQIVDTLRQYGVTVLAAVPPLWLQLLRVDDFTDRPLPDLRIMTNTGGRLPVPAVRTLRTAHPHARLFLMYGLTEAFRATWLPPQLVDARPDSIGKAIPQSEILVVRDDGSECAPGEEGELVQRGPTVALGYWDDPAATARVFRPNPLRPAGTPDAERVVYSGDIVRRDGAGFLYYVGRRDRMIKTLGHRVSPDEVADVIYASGLVAECIVGTEPDPERGDAIVAHVVLHDPGSLRQLERYCRAELPRYLQPSRLETHPDLPRTSSGKHDIRALHAPPLSAPSPGD